MNIFKQALRALVAVALALAIAPQASAYGADVNCDGEVTVADVTAIYDIILGISTNYAGNADVNHDGEVTVADITEIYDVINGLKDPVSDDELFDICYATLRSEQSITGLDASSTNFVRNMWCMNELGTDEALCTWYDKHYRELNFNRWGSDFELGYGLYLRLCNSIDICNDYLSRSSEHAAQLNAEVRFLRALYYFYLLDFYGRVPTNTDPAVATLMAAQQTRATVFNFVSNELLECENDLAEPRTLAYGRVDKAAVWLLRARLYLNAEVYAPTTRLAVRNLRRATAKEAAESVINSAYALNTTSTSRFSAFQRLFLGDNNGTAPQKEIVLPIRYSGHNYPAVADWEYSGSTFLVCATNGYDYQSVWPNGMSGTWSGIISRAAMVNKFNVPSSVAAMTAPDNVATQAKDTRALFLFSDTNPAISNTTYFNDGWAYCKWNNIYSNGTSPNTDFANVDFPLLRAAEAYLIYAEIDARQNNGSCTSDGLGKLNTLRQRAGATSLTSANIATIVDEWTREFGFEGQRRMHLVRNGYYGSNDLSTMPSGSMWDWRAGAKNGRIFDTYKNVFAIPAEVLAKNTSATQNPGYDINFAPMTITANHTEFFPELNANDELDLNWNAVTSSSYTIYPTYEVQASPDGNFTNKSSAYAESYSAGDYYVMSEDLEDVSASILPADMERVAKLADTNKLYFRVVANCSGTGKAVSNVIEVRVENVWWIIGTSIGNGSWTNSSDGKTSTSMIPMMRTAPGEQAYAGYFTSDAAFIILHTPGQWFPAYMWNDRAGAIKYTKNLADGRYCNSIPAPAGFNIIRLNTDTRQVTIEPISTTPASYSTIGLIGDFTGSNWTTETRFQSLETVVSSSYRHNWRLNNFSRSNDFSCKLRANNDWGTFWGITQQPADGHIRPFETLDPAPAAFNIQMQADSYDALYFNDILGTFMYFR